MPKYKPNFFVTTWVNGKAACSEGIPDPIASISVRLGLWDRILVLLGLPLTVQIRHANKKVLDDVMGALKIELDND